MGSYRTEYGSVLFTRYDAHGNEYCHCCGKLRDVKVNVEVRSEIDSFIFTHIKRLSWLDFEANSTDIALSFTYEVCSECFSALLLVLKEVDSVPTFLALHRAASGWGINSFFRTLTSVPDSIFNDDIKLRMLLTQDWKRLIIYFTAVCSYKTSKGYFDCPVDVVRVNISTLRKFYQHVFDREFRSLIGVRVSVFLTNDILRKGVLRLVFKASFSILNSDGLLEEALSEPAATDTPWQGGSIIRYSFVTDRSFLDVVWGSFTIYENWANELGDVCDEITIVFPGAWFIRLGSNSSKYPKRPYFIVEEH